MATASLGSILECSICLERFKKPKMLPCGHTFCLGCLERYITDDKVKFSCPFCNQEVNVPVAGAKDFPINYIAEINQPPPTTHPKCANHKQREVDYYCNNCNVGLCLKCIFKQHKDHETLDIECDETRIKAIEKLQRSQQIIQNRIKNLEKNRSTLLESFEELKSFCEDSCAKVTEQTEQIVTDLRKSCEQIKEKIKTNLEENRSKVEDREKEITSDINVLESNMDSIISPSTKTTLNILFTLPRLKEIEELGESMKDYNMCIQYLQWVGTDFSVDIDQLGSVISKSFYIPGSNQFLFNISDLKEDDSGYCSKSKNNVRHNNLVWSCYAGNSNNDLKIVIGLLSVDNPTLNHCNIDGQLSLLNIDDKSKSITNTFGSERCFNRGKMLSWMYPITWPKFTAKNNGYINSSGQFIVQYDITQIGELEFCQ